MKLTSVEQEEVFRSFQGKGCTLISNNGQCQSAIKDQLLEWGFQIKMAGLTHDSLKQVLRNKSQDILIIDDSENLEFVDSLMGGLADSPRIHLRLLANHQKVEKDWRGNGLTLKNPVHPTQLNARLSKLIATENSVKPKASSTHSHNSEIDINFANKHPHDILIVEDNSINAKVLQILLKKLGFSSDIAVNGEDCLKALEIKQYDILFMDIQMPLMDGYNTTVRIVNSDTITHPLYITAFTANVRQDDRDACEAVGMNDFVAKPARPNEIIEMILRAHKWLNKAVANES